MKQQLEYYGQGEDVSVGGEEMKEKRWITQPRHTWETKELMKNKNDLKTVYKPQILN